MSLKCGLLLTFMFSFMLFVVFHSPVGVAASRGHWLVDAIDYDYQGDSPVENIIPSSQDTCPPIPKSHSKNVCKQQQCNTDHDCKRKKHKRCCFNGCVYTCVRQIDKPSFVDWRKAPRRIVKSASFWLIRDPEVQEEFQSCSTSPVANDEDPLLCPEGYMCHIITPEDSKRKIPNRGRCVKENDDRTKKLILKGH